MVFHTGVGLFASKAVFPRRCRSASEARKEHGHQNLLLGSCRDAVRIRGPDGITSLTISLELAAAGEPM